ncbi:unnamed protein product [Alopecurus aequalis]
MAAQCCKKNMDTEMSPMSELADDLLVEIFSRVPLKSTCCCKCVSTRWRDLVSHPDHRRKMPQTLAGFFFRRHTHGPLPVQPLQPAYQSVSRNWYAGIDTSLSFLPRSKTQSILVLDCCNGLVLCRHRMHTDMKTIVYMVCNPATEGWVDVPATSWSKEVCFARLAFDPAVSSHFRVFEFAPAGVVDANMKGFDSHTKAVRIYSSEARAWTHRIVWGNPVSISSDSKGVFFSGKLYLYSSDNFVVAVSMEGNCRVIRVLTPHSSRDGNHLYLSRGQLHLANQGDFGLAIWVLDSSGENWTLKHIVSRLQLLGTEYSTFAAYYKVISVDQEHRVTFTVSGEGYRSPAKLMSYEMDSKKLSFICDIGWGCLTPYIPYVPLFSESVVDGH